MLQQSTHVHHAHPSRSRMLLTLLAGGVVGFGIVACAQNRTQADRNAWPRYDRSGVPVVTRAVSRDTGVSTRTEPVREPVASETGTTAPPTGVTASEPAQPQAAWTEPTPTPDAPVVATTIVHDAPPVAATDDIKPAIPFPREDALRGLATWKPQHAPTPRIVTLDGDMSEWTDGSVIRADEQYVYVRFSIAEGVYTLQSSNITTSIMLDVDADASTGKRIETDGTTLGVDVEVQMSPRRSGGTGRGAQVIVHDTRGGTTVQSPYDWDFAFAPTYASEWYEARISRTPTVTGVVREGMLSRGSVRGIVATLNSGGEIDASCDVFAAEGLSSARATRSDLPLPEKPSGSVRVVSYNVLRSSPNAKPQVFQRVLGALDPDIVLLQEWECTDEAQIREWFEGMLPSPGGWHVRAIADTVQNMGGVAIASRFQFAGEGERVMLSQQNNRGVRAKLGVVETMWGPIVLSSVHLKSGGSMGSREDEQRINEAGAVREALVRMGEQHPGAWRLVAGDMNLVGSRQPIEILARGADNDASDLLPVPSPIWGDGAMLTWSERGNAFTPGRLDWVLVGDSACRVLQSFVLDTSRLSDAVLARSGLTASDTAEASDHMPVVVDLAPAK